MVIKDDHHHHKGRHFLPICTYLENDSDHIGGEDSKLAIAWSILVCLLMAWLLSCWIILSITKMSLRIIMVVVI